MMVNDLMDRNEIDAIVGKGAEFRLVIVILERSQGGQ